MEACRLSAVCKRFLSAAESDLVWDRFLPSDYRQLRDRADALPNMKFAHKKDLFLFLIGNHVSMDGNTMVMLKKYILRMSAGLVWKLKYPGFRIVLPYVTVLHCSESRER
ncbi:putative F-box protein PP2-B12 isoform X2 [Daucus carota subsp. sativus]|uniref:putative F-box protein PP2-B12 isoform X2 n=1 Tax=Daucus carota subsp. sativus TaxID=79200 RepID=UPI0030832A63